MPKNLRPQKAPENIKEILSSVFFKEAPVGFVIIQLEDMKIIDYNEIFALQYAKKSSTLFGKKCSAVIGCFHEESCQKKIKDAKSGSVVSVETIKLSSEEKWVNIKKVLLDNFGMAGHMICFFNDVKDFSKVDAVSSKAWYILEQSPVSIVLTNKNSEIQYVNKKFCSSTGYTKDEVMGKNPRILKSGKFNSEDYKDMWYKIVHEGKWSGEFHNKRKNGELFWEWASISSIKDENDNITDYVAIKEDITEKKKTEEALLKAKEDAERANKAKSDFLAVMSHEIRTPMNGVLGAADLLSKTKLDDAQKKYVETIRFTGEGLLTIINDILDFSKIESGNLTLDFKPINARLFIEDTVNLFQNLAESKKLKLQLEIEKSVPQGLVLDSARFRQILLNLINNAIKFTGKGFVKITATAKKKNKDTIQLFIGVQDSGIGIDKTKLEKLFKPFIQEDSTTAVKFGGTGLGLAISKRLVELMGGEIGVTSEKEKGSEFKFNIQTKIADIRQINDSKELIKKTSENIAQKYPLRILVAEDNQINQMLILKMLSHFGYKADLAETGAEAVKKTISTGYDLIFMDIQMPQMSGIEAAKKIRLHYKRKEKPIIVALTAFAATDHKDLSYQAGMSDFLSKPLLLDKLYACIEKWGSALYSGKV